MPEPHLTILLIEDDQSTRELYQRELSRKYQVLGCASETEALALLHRHKVSAIVLEPALRSQQGWAFLEMLQAMLQTHTIPVILCSTQDNQRRGLELGAKGYLIKPVLPVVLLKAIQQAISSSTAG